MISGEFERGTLPPPQQFVHVAMLLHICSKIVNVGLFLGLFLDTMQSRNDSKTSPNSTIEEDVLTPHNSINLGIIDRDYNS